MSAAADRPAAASGDLVVVEGHRTGEGRRLGEILEVLGTLEAPHYRVHWEDGRDTVFFPSSDTTIKRATRRPARARVARG